MSAARGRRRGLTPAAIAIMFVVFGIPGAAVATWGADKLDSWMPDGEGTDSQAWLRTQDVAPGDTVAVSVAAKGGYKATITSMTARFGSSRVAVEGSAPDWGGSISARSTGEDSETFTIDIPADTPQRDSTIELKVAMVIAVPAGDRSFVNQESHDTIQVPITVRSPGARTVRRWMHRALALIAWAVSFAIAYVLVLLIPRDRPQDPDERDPGNMLVRLFVVAVFGGIFLLGVAGQLVFVRPLLDTMSSDSWFVTTGLMILWLLSLVSGSWRGMRRRAQNLRWSPLRLRSVLGSTVPTLPPELSRDSTRHTDSDLEQAISRAGCALVRVRNRLEVRQGAEQVLRLRPKQPSPWAPEDLRAEVYDENVPESLLVQLAALFGPIQYRTLSGASRIVESA